MVRENSEVVKFLHGNAEYCVCSEGCKAKMKKCLAAPQKMRLTPYRWTGRHYAMPSRDAIIFREVKRC
jgi:hypothetical protein